MFDTLTRLGSSAAGAYEIERSLRIEAAGSSIKLDRTFGTNSSNTTKTLSFWMKRASIDGTQTIFATTSDGNIESRLDLLSDGSIQFADRDSGDGTSDAIKNTSRRYKDINGWYHIVLIIDTTNGAASDRIRLYTNGVRDTSFASSTDPSSSYAVSFFRSSVANFIGANNTNNYCSLYLSEIHFLDGTIKEPSKFGETNADTGQWVPIEYTEGGYGTNGFYLNFSDNSNNTAATIGADSSGNGNNWTPTNVTVTAGFDNDCVFDTPTNNYCTLSSTDGGAVSQSIKVNGNLETATTNGSGHHPCYSTIAVNSGKWYVEYETVGSDNWGIYIAPIAHDGQSHDQDSAVHNTQSAQLHKGYSLAPASGNAYSGPADTWNSSYGSALGTVGMLAFDLDNNKIYWGSDGTWYDSGDPAAGNNPAFSSIVVNEPFCVGVTTSNGLNCKINFGAQGFQHTPPTGFKALCTQNLPEPTIKDPSSYFKTLLYTGNATNDRTITGVGFQPDLLWIKDRDTASNAGRHYLFDKLRQSGGESVLGMVTDDNGDDNDMSANGRFNGIRSDGFEVSGSDVDTNANATKYVTYSWKESATAGFDIVSYSGTGSSRTVSHSLGVAPEMMMIKNRSANENWIVYHAGIASDAETDYIILNTNGAAGDDTWLNDTAPTSSQWEYSGGGATFNNSGNDYIAYLWASVEGYSKVGYYYGDGQQAGPFIFTGFKPSWVLVKNVENASSVWNLHDAARDPYNIVNKVLYPNTNDNEEAYAVGTASSTNKLFLANGFQIFSTHDPEMNASDERYIYLAFAERPFKYANAR